MVQECYKYVDAVTDLTIKLRLIDTLRTVTAGKVWNICDLMLISENLYRFGKLSKKLQLNNERLG